MRTRESASQPIVLRPVTWTVQQLDDCWVAECGDLGLTVESATWAELMEDIAAVLGAVFSDLWASGDLERFLHDRNLMPARRPLPEIEPVFDIPFVPALVSSEDPAASAYR